MIQTRTKEALHNDRETRLMTVDGLAMRHMVEMDPEGLRDEQYTKIR